jgi:hypothetical protein
MGPRQGLISNAARGVGHVLHGLAGLAGIILALLAVVSVLALAFGVLLYLTGRGITITPPGRGYRRLLSARAWR